MQKKHLLACLAFVLVALVWLAVDPRGLRHTRRLQEDLVGHEATNARLREENARLRRELERLAADPAALERAAREELGLIRPDEVVFRLEEGDEDGRP